MISKKYSDEDGPWVHKPTGIGPRLIIINAITKNGWVPGARLIFKSSRKTGSSNGQMDHALFTKWFNEPLLPLMKSTSLIVMDNASYHNVYSSHSAPTKACKKDEIFAWLNKNGM